MGKFSKYNTYHWEVKYNNVSRIGDKLFAILIKVSIRVSI